MVLTSGNPPYDYAAPDPLRVPSPYTNVGLLGPSGIFLEQAQFVATAETRKFSSSSHELSDMFVYVNPVIAPSGPYEPKADGSTLANRINPGNLFIINHILEARNALDVMLAAYEAESENTYEDFLKDWLWQIAPELGYPSGFYRREDPFITEEPVEATLANVYMLGGSGVLLDLDFAEVMYNPYPWFSSNVFRDIHNLGTFRIVNGPVWPCFQKTNGSLISLNGREPGTAEGVSAEFDFSRIPSNEVRLDGYVFLPETDYLIGHGLRDFVVDGQFTYVSSSPRAVNNGRTVQTTRVFASTQALSSGVYKLAARNRKEVVPFTTVASGLISQWPPSGQAYPAIGTLPLTHQFDIITPFNARSVWYNNAEYEHGYQVFDDAFWIIDHADGDREPSGLAVASPFTGHCMWLRFADLTQSSGSGVFGGLANSAKSWGGHVGLEKVGSTIYRVQKARADGSVGSLHTALIQKYNSSLDYLGQIETVEFSSFEGNYHDLIYQPSLSRWIFYSTTAAGGLGIDVTDSTFSTVISENGAFYIGAASLSAGNAISNSRIIFGAGEYNNIMRSPAEFSDGNNATGFRTRGSGIWDLEFDVPGSGVIFKDCRIIDMSKVTKQFSATAEATIYDLVNITSATHVKPGFYALASFGSSTSQRLFLLRIEPRDDATAPAFCVGFWDVLAAYDLGTLPSTVSTSINNVPNMLYQAID